MICPRCDSEKVDLLTKSPVGDFWEVYICDACTFSWRNTESERVTDPEKYDARFKMTQQEIDDLGIIPPIPKLKV